MDDVKKHAKGEVKKSVEVSVFPEGRASQPLPDFSQWGEIESKPMSSIRRAIAKSTNYSWSTVPHVYQFDRADITDVEVFRKKFSKKVEQAGSKLTITAILMKIIAYALKAMPQFNASLDLENEQIIYKKYVHIGVAVDTDRGLLVPVVRDVDKKSLVALSVELSDLAEKARNKKITVDEMQGGCFSISNLGGMGGTNFTPIVYAPQVAILGVSRANTEAIYRDGQFVPRLILPLCLSYDHRMIDGADGIRFLRWIIDALEHPLALLLEGNADTGG